MWIVRSLYNLFLVYIIFASCTTKHVIVDGKSTWLDSSYYGIPINSKSDVSRELQNYINNSEDNTIRLKKGVYNISQTLIIPSGKIIDGNQSEIHYNGKNAAFKIGDNEIAWRSSIRDLNIFLKTAGSKGIDASWARASSINNCLIQLRNNDQVGIYLKGIAGKSPYQNIFTENYITGDIRYNNQIGILLDDGDIWAKASGPNRNIFSNFKQVASLTHAVVINSGDGNVFSNFVTENITDYHFKLNDIPPKQTLMVSSGTLSSFSFKGSIKKLHSGHIEVISGTNKGFTAKISLIKGSSVILDRPAEKEFDSSSKIAFYESKANNNIISNTVTEARSTSVFAKLGMGASNNYFRNNYITSISNLKFERSCEENSNQIGDETYMVFSLDNIVEDKLNYITPSAGFVMPYTGFISGITVTASNMGKNANIEVLLRKSGLIIEDLKTKMNGSRNLTAMEFLQMYDTSNTAFVKAGQRVSIELNTNGRLLKNAKIMVGVSITRI